ncbi:unnamed protein product [Effrenium voratum]|nr:unnamed protein product [Effrenium voratum]
MILGTWKGLTAGLGAFCTRLPRLGASGRAGYSSPDVGLDLEKHVILEPKAEHKGTILCLHGLGDSSKYWEQFFEALCTSQDLAGIRCLALDAPRRLVWGERQAAWFEYLSDKSGTEEEDEINEKDLEETCRALHAWILREAASGLPVLLLGSSQGGSVACHAALTAAAPLAGVAMLRSLVLSATAKAAATRQKLPLLAVSGASDDVFLLPLVERNLKSIAGFAQVKHQVIEGLDHMTEYDAQELALVAGFIAERLKAPLGSDLKARLAQWTSARCPRSKAWEQLTDSELRMARQLGCKCAANWDEASAKVWELKWDQLSHLQRQAAAALGFTADDWDGDKADAADGASGDPAADRSWEDLDDDMRALAAKLGVKSRRAWDEGTAPVWQKLWRKLSPAEKKAAEALGFTQPRWDEERRQTRLGDAQSTQRHGATGRVPRAMARPSASRQNCQELEEEHERMREEVVDLKITVDGLETERDFYFQKLRDVEIMCQAWEENPDASMTVSKFVEEVQNILYAKDDEELDNSAGAEQ